MVLDLKANGKMIKNLAKVKNNTFLVNLGGKKLFLFLFFFLFKESWTCRMLKMIRLMIKYLKKKEVNTVKFFWTSEIFFYKIYIWLDLNFLTEIFVKNSKPTNGNFYSNSDNFYSNSDNFFWKIKFSKVPAVCKVSYMQKRGILLDKKLVFYDLLFKEILWHSIMYIYIHVCAGI